MTNPWDQFEKPSTEGTFVDLKNDGDSYTGVLAGVESVMIPAGTMPNQPNDLTGVPRLFFTDGRRLDATATVLRNHLVTLAPPIGSTIRIKRLGKPKGKGWVDYLVHVPGSPTPMMAEEIPFVKKAATQTSEISSTPAATARDNDLPPF